MKKRSAAFWNSGLEAEPRMLQFAGSREGWRAPKGKYDRGDRWGASVTLSEQHPYRRKPLGKELLRLERDTSGA